MTIPNDDAGAEQTFKTSFAARFAKPLSAEDREANLKADLAVNAGVDMLLQDLAPYARLARMRKVALRAGLNMMSFALEKSMARVETGRAQIRSQIASLETRIEKLAAEAAPLIAQHENDRARRAQFPRPAGPGRGVPIEKRGRPDPAVPLPAEASIRAVPREPTKTS